MKAVLQNPKTLMPVSPDFDVTIPVLVFKIGRYPIHHGTLGIIRSLGKKGVPVYAIVENRFTPAAVSRYLTGAFIWDTRDLDSATLLCGLASIGNRLGRPAILIPTDDSAAAFIAEHTDALLKWFLFPQLPKDLPRRLSNKKDLYLICKTYGVPCPEAAFPNSMDDVRTFIEHATFPVVVKVMDSQRSPKGVSSTSIIQTPRELVAIYQQAESTAKSNLMFQEYIPQSCAEDWIFHGYCNPQTGCCVAFTGKKFRSFPPFAGYTTLGASISNEPLSQQTELLLRAIAYAGIVDIDCRLDKRDGQYKLLDFNPRIGANFRMFEDSAGVDVVRALHLDLTGKAVPRLPAVENRTFVVEPYDLLASLGYMRFGELTIKSWWQSLKGKREFGWFHWRDPVPFFAMCSHLLFLFLQL